MKKTRKTLLKQQKYHDLIFSFKNAKIDVDFTEDSIYYDNDQDLSKIKNIAKNAAKEIIIDKSYVIFDKNKHKKTFIREEGWKSLCLLVLDTKFGNKCTDVEYCTILEAYKLFIICYLILLIDDCGYDTDEIVLSMPINAKFLASVEIDNINAWKSYPGRWQEWK